MDTSAGILFWRKNIKGLEVLLVHPSSDIHSNYDKDWSIPKGWIDEGETRLEAAWRECREEINSPHFYKDEYPESEYHGAVIYKSRKKKLNIFSVEIIKRDAEEFHEWVFKGDYEITTNGTRVVKKFEPAIASWELDGVMWVPIGRALKIGHEVILGVLEELNNQYTSGSI